MYHSIIGKRDCGDKPAYCQHASTNIKAFSPVVFNGIAHSTTCIHMRRIPRTGKTALLESFPTLKRTINRRTASVLVSVVKYVNAVSNVQRAENFHINTPDEAGWKSSFLVI
ncbi:hypothetical protein ACJMK2_042719 [Sinanodonta woodiana]|uniref:Uncharacterized protein n=1 Tax=Sinanodonta woodiana TaxID=1069815 RepID=A0ABD3W934_SINWO